MARSNTVQINIIGDASDAKRAFNEIGDSAHRLGSSLGSTFTKMGKTLAVGIGVGVGAAAAGIGALVADGAKSIIGLEKIAAQTSAVIKSTGGAAKVSAGEVALFAENMERLTGIEQEGIREGANLLLTFTNIQNRVGKGNDVFNQANKTLLDMSVALGTDVKSSAIQLGKALNDPVEGITALTRVGVTFTEQQKEQIKAMTEAGDVAGAQKVILAELNKEFGGSAEAFGDTAAGRMAKFKNALGDIGEAIAGHLLPLGEKLVTWASTLLPAALEKAEVGMGTLVARITPLGGLVAAFAETHLPLVKEALRSVGETVGSLAGRFNDDLFQALEHGSASVFPAGIRDMSALDVVIGRLAQAAAFLKQRWDEMYPSLRDAALFVRDTALEAFEGIKRSFLDNKEQLHQLAVAFTNIAQGVGPALVVGIGLVGAAIQATITVVGGLVRAITWLADVAGTASVKLPMMWEGLKESFRDAVNWIIRKWNALEFKAPTVNGVSILPGGIGSLQTPDIPLLAKGGIVTRPTVAVVGEAGPEAVVPLSRGGMAAPVVNVAINANVIDRSAADWIVRQLEEHFARGGVIGNRRGAYVRPA